MKRAKLKIKGRKHREKGGIIERPKSPTRHGQVLTTWLRITGTRGSQGCASSAPTRLCTCKQFMCSRATFKRTQTKLTSHEVSEYTAGLQYSTEHILHSRRTIPPHGPYWRKACVTLPHPYISQVQLNVSINMGLKSTVPSVES